MKKLAGMLMLFYCSVSLVFAGTNFLIRGDAEGGWGFFSPDPSHVQYSMIGGGRGDGGNALSFTNSVYDEINAQLQFQYGVGVDIPNDSVVYVGTWVRVSADFAQTVADTGIEVRLRLASSANPGIDYWSSNSPESVFINSLTFGWDNPQSVPLTALSTEWRYFEFPVQTGDSGTASWTYAQLAVHDRVGWSGNLAAGFNGTIYFDDLYVGLSPQVVNCNDAGAYHYPGDVNADCTVDDADIMDMSLNWLVNNTPVNADVYKFDESTDALIKTGDANPEYEAGATGDMNGTNALIFANGAFSAALALEPVSEGQTNLYRISSRRKVHATGNLNYKIGIDGTRFAIDTAIADASLNESFVESSVPGFYSDSTGSVDVSLYEGGAYAARVDYIKFVKTNEILADESLSWTFNNFMLATLAYETGASPDDGSSENSVDVGAGGVASTTINLRGGTKYKVKSRRRVHDNNQLAFSISIDGNVLIRDEAMSFTSPYESFQEVEYLGYYVHDSNEPATLTIYDGGGSFARVDYITFEATSDKYFDENTPGISHSAMLSGPWYTPNSIPEDLDQNAAPAIFNCMTFQAFGSYQGNVQLQAGEKYRVYTSRTVDWSQTMNYDIFLDGEFFAHDVAFASDAQHINLTEEMPIGYFIPQDDSTQVQLTNGGQGYARVDYIRFELVNPKSCDDLGMVYLDADVNKDCFVDMLDLAVLSNSWLECSDPQDINCELF